MSFVSSKPDPYPTPVDVVVYLISAIMNRVIKRFYCNLLPERGSPESDIAFMRSHLFLCNSQFFLMEMSLDRDV